MSENVVVRARISPKIKEEASIVLKEMGLTVSDVFRMTLSKIAKEKALPFDLHIPNSETIATLEKSERGEDLHHAKNAEELFEQLGI